MVTGAVAHDRRDHVLGPAHLGVRTDPGRVTLKPIPVRVYKDATAWYTDVPLDLKQPRRDVELNVSAEPLDVRGRAIRQPDTDLCIGAIAGLRVTAGQVANGERCTCLLQCHGKVFVTFQARELERFVVLADHITELLADRGSCFFALGANLGNTRSRNATALGGISIRVCVSYRRLNASLCACFTSALKDSISDRVSWLEVCERTGL